ncbi:MAG TPA: exosortase H-associated membrane protein [Thermoanaerobaculia bacterium]|nr:exosortase H-associated membrane protein [Thermoanaerobaculia bacterium]
MPRFDWRTAVRALIGFVLGVVLWTMLSPIYNRVIETGAEFTIRLFESPSVTSLKPDTDNESYATIDRSDFDPRSKRPGVPVSDLTFNVILLIALFAMESRPFSDRNIRGFVFAAIVLAFTHVFGLITEVMSVYVLKLGPWSTVHYGDVARNFWSVANHFYRLVLMYGIAFALWWIFRANPERAERVEGATEPSRKKRRKR